MAKSKATKDNFLRYMLFEKGWVGGDKLLIEKTQNLKSLFPHQILKEQALGYDDAIVIN